MVRRNLGKLMSPVHGLDMTEPTEDGLLDKVKVNIPMGRLGREQADSIEFLLRGFSSFAKGQVWYLVVKRYYETLKRKPALYEGPFKYQELPSFFLDLPAHQKYLSLHAKYHSTGEAVPNS